MTGRRYVVETGRLPLRAMFDLRGGEASLRHGLEAAKLPFPAARNRIASAAQGIELLRLGPGRVLVVGPIEREAELHAALDAAFVGESEADHAQVSDMFAAFSVKGPGAYDALKQGAPLDLSPEAFPAGSATGTELWATSVVLLRRPDPDGFEILVERSFAGYVEDWLTVASGGASTLLPGVLRAPPPPVRVP